MHLQENRVSPNSTRSAHPSSEVSMCFYFFKAESNNSAPFPVYKPPTTLPGMVSGQKEGKKKHLARLTKLFELTRYLQILKMVDGESRMGEGGCILANKRLRSMRRHLFTSSLLGNYGRSQTYTGRGSQHRFKRKGLLS